MSTCAGSETVALRATNLNTFYGKSQALFDVCIEVPRTGLVGILGRNGAGKTTLLKTLAGELLPRSGEISLAGQPITATATEMRVRAGLGYVPQEHPIFARLTVRENLAIGSLLAQDGAFDRVLEIFPKLSGRLSQTAGTLSGGERKMLAIARALLSGPKVLLLDEPTEGVWLGVVEEIAERLAELSKNIAVVLVEQNLDLVLGIADTSYVMDRGTVALSGETAFVRNHELLTKLLSP